MQKANTLWNTLVVLSSAAIYKIGNNGINVQLLSGGSRIILRGRQPPKWVY